jgi:hypothetical protein
MRLFIRHKKNGEIVSVAKAHAMPEGLEHPYADVGEDEAVLEVKPSAEIEKLAAHEIAERFSVDVEGKRLKPLTEDKPAHSGLSQRRRRSNT